jgi:hypothetical protein
MGLNAVQVCGHYTTYEEQFFENPRDGSIIWNCRSCAFYGFYRF